MPLGINPDSDKPAVLPAGQVGLGGEASLVSICARKVPGENSEGYYVDFNVQVDTPDMGRLFLHSQPFGDFHTQTGRTMTPSFAKAFLASVGVSPESVQFADEPDDKGNYALLGQNPCPMKVVVDVALDTYKDKQGNTKSRNGIKSIARLG